MAPTPRILTRTALALVVSCLTPAYGLAQRAIDGSGNHPLDLGAKGDVLIRLTDDAYADGLAAPSGATRPGAREISNAVSSQSSSIEDARGVSNLFWLFGQFLDHDIDLTHQASPAEAFDIPVPVGDPFFDPFSLGTASIGLDRSDYAAAPGPRQQVNDITSWIDGSAVYGSDTARAAFLRAGDGTGRLVTSTGELLPFNTGGFDNANAMGAPDASLFLAGDVRANENVALTAMHTVWMREHNRLADEIAASNPGLSGDEIYQAARLRVGAEMQAITYNEYLPMLLGEALGDYAGYDPSLDPRIANEFSTAAYRFGHTMLSENLPRLAFDGTPAAEGDLLLRDAFFNPAEVSAHGIDSILLGMSESHAQALDPFVVDAVRNFLFGPPGAGGFDLVSLNIQRGRDHGLGTLHEVRLGLGLEGLDGFDDITGDVMLQALLASVYDDVTDVDLWVGGLAEDPMTGGMLGETFAWIVADQFERLRGADAWWYELAFSGAELSALQALTLADVIERNTGIRIHGQAFLVPEPGSALLLLGVFTLVAWGRRRP